MFRKIARLWAGTHRAFKFLLLLILLTVGYLAAAPFLEVGGVRGLKARPAPMARLDQGWERDLSDRHHGTSQGTKILPLSWFLALEQPVATPLPVGRYASRDYLARFGFLYPDERNPDDDGRDPGDPDLPVGFAVEPEFLAPYANPPIEEPTRVVGLTCAACHTGRIDLEVGEGLSRPFLVDGGSAMINLSAYQQATSTALYLTSALPWRFDRFAAEVVRLERIIRCELPATAEQSKAEAARIRKDLGTYIRLGLATREFARDHKLTPIEAGFSRTDALGLIGNRVFGVLDVENQTVTDAPVNFPHLWDTPWFDWVQYNASIRTPMARNIGEALGVGALINLTDARFPLYDSTVNVRNLHAMEDWIAGPAPFRGLQPPRWEDMLARAFPDEPRRRDELAPKPVLVEAGRKLYEKLCEHCHLPPRKALEEDLKASSPKYFGAPDASSGRRFLRLNLVDLSIVGTDPNQALNFYRRVAVATEPPDDRKAGPLPEYRSTWIKQVAPRGPRSSTISAEEGLFRVTSMVRALNYRGLIGLLAPPGTRPKEVKAYNDEKRRKEERMAFDGYRGVPEILDFGDVDAIIEARDMGQVIRKNLGYKARPLDGIWATPPYLHNGSVPNLHQLLLPAGERAPTFYLGSTLFDPVHVGYRMHQVAGSSEMDTSLSGNRNQGHEFRDLTIDELENASRDESATLDQRWARVLRRLLGMDLEDYTRRPLREHADLATGPRSGRSRSPGPGRSGASSARGWPRRSDSSSSNISRPSEPSAGAGRGTRAGQPKRAIMSIRITQSSNVDRTQAIDRSMSRNLATLRVARL